MSSAFADTKPFVQVRGADVSAGGGVEGNPGTPSYNCLDNYQSPGADPKTGGILTFNRAPNGSSSQYGAFALGLMEGNGTTNDFGFATRGNNQLSFANSNSGLGTNWGGLFGARSCTPNYFGKAPAAATGFALSDLTSGALVFKKSNGPITIADGNAAHGGTITIPAGVDKSIFIDGNLYITDNIVYAPHGTVGEIPKLAIVVKGDIFVDNDVTTLEGFYVAQPRSSTADDGGKFWSCSINGFVAPTAPELRSCNNPLTINGALAAAKVHLLRISGDAMTGAGPTAEIFNYDADMVLGGGFFNDGSRQNEVKFDSVISLPPIF